MGNGTRKKYVKKTIRNKRRHFKGKSKSNKTRNYTDEAKRIMREIMKIKKANKFNKSNKIL